MEEKVFRRRPLLVISLTFLVSVSAIKAIEDNLNPAWFLGFLVFIYYLNASKFTIEHGVLTEHNKFVPATNFKRVSKLGSAVKIAFDASENTMVDILAEDKKMGYLLSGYKLDLIKEIIRAAPQDCKIYADRKIVKKLQENHPRSMPNKIYRLNQRDPLSFELCEDDSEHRF